MMVSAAFSRRQGQTCRPVSHEAVFLMLVVLAGAAGSACWQKEPLVHVASPKWQ